MIDVEGLVKKFGRCAAVDDVSFRVEPGEAVALWGANGAGKTTAIRCVLGLLSFRGSITVAGHDVRRAGKAARRSVGYVPQELALYDDLRLPDALHLFARLKRAPRPRPGAVLDEVGLADHRRKRIRELSGGMKQRMALAIALLADPPLLILDELTANLDAAAQGSFMTLLRDLKKRGKTILFTSHHHREVESLADRVLILERGRLVDSCPARGLAEHTGARCLLHVRLADDVVDDALHVLVDGGFDVTRNGHGLHVRVPVGAKAAPIGVLARRGITVRDFEVGGNPIEEGADHG
jgi:ABC-type multidrug transport system ATPase subunit